MTALAKVPITYEPAIRNGVYVDSLTKYKWTEFDEFGVKCPCTKSRTIHRNKNSFKHQHCKTKKHKEYLEKLNEDPAEPDDPLEGDAFLKQIKQFKIQLGQEHQSLQLEKQKNMTLQSQLKDLISEKQEALAEAKQANDYAEEITQKLCEMAKTNKELETRFEQYDTVTREMMRLGGYELDGWVSILCLHS